MGLNVFDLEAVISLNDSAYKTGLEKAADMGKSVVGGIGKIAKVGFGVATAAIGAGTAAMGAFGKSALESYSNYEQLEGGIQKLYGESDKATARMMENAQKAYKTAGMSANQYMDTAMQFSASMISSLDGNLEEAANMTDVAMRAMSDNVNTFGSNMQDVSNAFKGFSKANFTMLDNLKLGYGGTKEEMERLLRDAEKYEGYIENSLDVNNFADIVDAIQIVQEHLNIAGTTGREAMTTIEGSATMVKAAWENLTTAIGSGEGITEAFSGLKDAIFGIGLTEDGKETGLLNQIVPRIQTIMSGAGEAIVEAAPLIAEKLPTLIEAILPPMVDGGIALIGAIGKGIVDAAPALWTTIENTASTIGTYLSDGMENAAKATENVDFATPIGNALDKVDELLNGEKTQKFIEDGVTVVSNLAQGIGDAAPDVIPKAAEIVTNFANGITDNIPQLLDAGGQMTLGIAEGVIKSAPKLLLAVYEIKFKIIGYIAEMASNVVKKGVEGFSNLLSQAIPVLAQLPSKVAYHTGETIAKFKNKIDELPEKAKEAFDNAVKKAEDFIKKFKEKAADGGKGFRDDLMNAITGLIDDIGQFFDNLRAKVEEKWNSLVSFVTGKKSEMDAAYNEGYNNTRNVPEGHSGKSGVLNAAPLFDAIDYTTGLNNEFSTNTVIDYDLLGKAIVKAFTDADVAVECDDREFGRLVRKAVME